MENGELYDGDNRIGLSEFHHTVPRNQFPKKYYLGSNNQDLHLDDYKKFERSQYLTLRGEEYEFSFKTCPK